jgi:hypothetical protein
VPILKPDIQRVLQQAGLEKSEEVDMTSLLESNNLDKGTLLDRLRDLIECGENESTRIRALELSLKLHGLLKDVIPTPASVTILIKDPSDKSSSAISGVNPVVLPRQLKTESESNPDLDLKNSNKKDIIQ